MSTDYTWWKHGIIYQIYPRSFQDSNGDGIGDIPGITSRLDYLAELGVDAIWISPFYPSPKHDMGYDVADYCDVDPDYGTLDDFDRLVTEAHSRKIRVVLDFVMNHTSSHHPWFVDARSGKDAERRDHYIWHPGRSRRAGRRPSPPSNWQSSFGGSAWEWDTDSGEYNLHLFHKDQPDLNWRNPAVKEHVFGWARFWLDRGVDGFRLDVINYIVKDEQLRSNPYKLHKAYPRPHDQQLHVYDRNRPESHDLIREFRKLLDEYGETMLVGEVYPNEGIKEPERAAAYQGNGTDELHLAFDLSFKFASFRARDFRGALTKWYAAQTGDRWPCHVLNNHDQSRTMSRMCKGDPRRAKLLATLLLTQRGTPFVYYGEEIGMTDGSIPKSELKDPVAIRYWPLHPGRDPERTPMQWDGSTGAGFTTGNSTWLPINPDSADRNVEAQSADDQSLLSWYRRLIRLRRETPALTHGTIEFLDTGDPVLVYQRELQGEDAKAAVLLNFSKKPQNVIARAGSRPDREPALESLLSGGQKPPEVISSAGIHEALAPLAPYEARIVVQPIGKATGIHHDAP